MNLSSPYITTNATTAFTSTPNFIEEQNILYIRHTVILRRDWTARAKDGSRKKSPSCLVLSCPVLPVSFQLTRAPPDPFALLPLWDVSSSLVFSTAKHFPFDILIFKPFVRRFLTPPEFLTEEDAFDCSRL